MNPTTTAMTQMKSAMTTPVTIRTIVVVLLLVSELLVA